MHRVVLPLRDATGAVRSFTARALDSRTPKYLTGQLPSGFVCELAADSPGPVLVTEDYLSALKLEQCGIHVISLLGTYAKPATLTRLLELKDVMVWLDNDLPPKHRVNWGQERAAKLCRSLRAMGSAPVNIVSDQEPKALDKLSILRVLALNATGRTPSVNAPDGE
jgi:DNA primase